MYRAVRFATARNHTGGRAARVASRTLRMRRSADASSPAAVSARATRSVSWWTALSARTSVEVSDIRQFIDIAGAPRERTAPSDRRAALPAWRGIRAPT
jgi:hypothetical protein